MHGYGRLVYHPRCSEGDHAHTEDKEDEGHSHYIGYFENGKRHGKGTMHFLDEDKEE